MLLILETIDLTDSDPLERWESGAAGPCPVCGEQVAAGSDCRRAHYSKAIDMVAGNTLRLASAVKTLRGQE